MDRVVLYLAYSRVDGLPLARRLADEFRRGAIPPALMPDPDRDGVSDPAAIGGCDAVSFLLTPASAAGDTSCREEARRAQELGKEVIAVRPDEAVAIRGPAITFGLPPSHSDRAELWRRVANVSAPSRARDECRRALAAWGARLEAARVLAPIEREIAEHERRASDPDNPFAEFEMQAEADRARPGSRVHATTVPTRRGGLHDRDEVIDAITRKLADPGLTLLTLRGESGVGKTAMVGELRIRLQALTDEPVAVVYLSAHGNAPLSATMVLRELALVSDVRTPEAHLVSVVREPSLTWAAAFDRLLKALAGLRVLVILDNASDLFDESRRFVDPAIRGMVRNTLARDDHRLQWLLVDPEPPDLRSLARRAGHIDEVPLGGLRPVESIRFLRELDGDRLVGLAESGEADLDRLSQLAAGRPRALELAYAALRADPTLTVPLLLREIEMAYGDPVAVTACLVGLAIDGLTRAQLRVAQVLAAYGHPVSPLWVDAVLSDVLPGYRSAATLDQLSDMRLIQRYGDRFHFPRVPNEASPLARLPHGRQPGPNEVLLASPLTEVWLYALAARCCARYAELFGAEPESVDDLEPALRQVHLLVRAELYDEAVKRMAELDHHLSVWGQSFVLTQARTAVQSKLSSPQWEASNLSMLAAAYSQLGEHDRAGQALAGIRDWLDHYDDERSDRHQLRLRLQLAGNQFDRGYVEDATEQYLSTIASADEADLEVQARTGLMLCHSEHGEFANALHEYERAREKATASATVRAELCLNVASTFAYTGRLLEAEAALYEAERLAGTSDEGVRGLCLTARATLAIDRGDHAAAAEYARAALEIGARRRHVYLSREANNRLALACLCTNDLDGARDAADDAVRFPDSRRSLGALALRGLVAFRRHDPMTAVSALRAAASQAHPVVPRESRNFELFDWYGMVLCLLAHYDEADLSLAEDAYQRARSVTEEPVAVARSLRLLDQVGCGPADPGLLRQAKAAAQRLYPSRWKR
ncbi:tetratricopeptide repeat protein [Asanoa siamensis]|uniref:Uncharacterized protein n=1 Tax=Asanoa siamensis TaxID=926357 RepID=A0ABQ4D4P1_9ACTN|nr:ATP-binding protein [Asanoa siamensis]GIF78514.1 hypothetical protein Asi02nite_80320 [Asanoa siamensis]